MNEFGGEIRQTPEEIRREKINRNVRELARRKETQEISVNDFTAEGIHYLQEEDQPITRRIVGNSAVVLSQDELEGLGYLELVTQNGETILIDPADTGYKPDDLLIIFPEELGDSKE